MRWKPDGVLGAPAHVQVQCVPLVGHPPAQRLRETPIEVVAAEEVVAVDRQHLILAAQAAQDRHVERPAAEVVDEEVSVAELVPPRVVDGRRGGLLQQADDFEPGHLAGVAGRLHLRRIEVGGHRDDRAFHANIDLVGGARAEVLEHARLQVREDFRGDLLRRELVRPDLHRGGLPHLAFDRLDGWWSPSAAIARAAPDEPLLLVGVPRDGAGDRLSTELVRVHDQVALGRVENRDLRVGRSEVDADGAIYEHQGVSKMGSSSSGRSGKR